MLNLVISFGYELSSRTWRAVLASEATYPDERHLEGRAGFLIIDCSGDGFLIEIVLILSRCLLLALKTIYTSGNILQ